MARYIIEIDDSEVERFEQTAKSIDPFDKRFHPERTYNGWVMSEGQVYPECDTRTFMDFEVIGKVDEK